MSKTFIDRTNETNMSTYGQLMTIIKYRSVKDIDVLFENGTIVEHKSYENFLRGNIRNPNLRLGETSISSKGQKMKIIAYHSADNVDIEFEDGTIVKHKLYKSFKQGLITNPNYFKSNHIGETNFNNQGCKMIIIEYRKYFDIDIQFDDGTIVQHKEYKAFKAGEIRNPNKEYHPIICREGESIINHQGMKMTIIKYRNTFDIDIEFEDGTIVQHKAYSNFIRKNINNPNKLKVNPNTVDRTGEERIANNGMKMKVIKFRGARDIDIEFEDGTIVTNKSMSEFRKGKIGNPNFILPYTLNSIIIEKLAYKSINRNYYCTCTLCGYKDIMNLDEIKSHICKEIYNG